MKALVMSVGGQSGRSGLGDHYLETRRGDIVGRQPLAILAEGRRRPDAVVVEP
jgi:hypothetical protein